MADAKCDVSCVQDGADRGGEDAASPPQQQAAGPSADEDEMVELPLGACQKYIPRRWAQVYPA